MQIYTKPGQIVSDYHPLFSDGFSIYLFFYLIFWMQMCGLHYSRLKSKKIFLDAYAVGHVFPRSSICKYVELETEDTTNLKSLE